MDSSCVPRGAAVTSVTLCEECGPAGLPDGHCRVINHRAGRIIHSRSDRCRVEARLFWTLQSHDVRDEACWPSSKNATNDTSMPLQPGMFRKNEYKWLFSPYLQRYKLKDATCVVWNCVVESREDQNGNLYWPFRINEPINKYTITRADPQVGSLHRGPQNRKSGGQTHIPRQAIGL